ncbi:hypothetical protein BKA70DRAFT_1337741 [Coprinopsis sp. MPI-PUGE-AT-0042]|nr:hypothetical protein BKA70DRAFT_1337741 [Coprinopsis sp. MPI-PUGE-AT-0042]
MLVEENHHPLPSYLSSMQRPGNNPTGKNQHPNCPPKGDSRVLDLLRKYHNDGHTNRDKVSKAMWDDHSIEIGPATVARRWGDMGLRASTSNTRDTPAEKKRQLVLDAMSADPAGRMGPATIRQNIRQDTHQHLTFKCVTSEMRDAHPEGFAARDPTAKKMTRTPLFSAGPHAEWSMDGHDKFKDVGFAIWGLRDKWSRKWLGLWVVPCNRTLEIVAYCYLTAILEARGRPTQGTTDCGSETTLIYGLANALDELDAELVELDNGTPATALPHMFLKSVRNITIERGWVTMRTQVIDNLRIFWDAGAHLFDPSVSRQNDLVNWLWSKFIQEQLDAFRYRNNNHKIRSSDNPHLPSGMTPEEAIQRYQRLGATWGLKAVDCELISQLREAIGGETLLHFNTLAYRDAAQANASSYALVDYFL